jgi:uncharacterized protein
VADQQASGAASVEIGRTRRVADSIALALVRAYQVGVAPLTGGACRFTPSCSAYAVDAVEIHGAARGLWLALRRVARCHPWGGFGHDPVPHAHGPACAGGSSRTLES